jgi:hypothetical protein
MDKYKALSKGRNSIKYPSQYSAPFEYNADDAEALIPVTQVIGNGGATVFAPVKSV